MKNFLPTIVIRHRRENLKKCSLRGLENHPDFIFFRYPLQQELICENYVMLCMDAEKELSNRDCDSGLLILDATWRLAQKMVGTLPFPPSLKKRRLPHTLQTAYPRRQGDCQDPSRGLASIEAVVAALAIMGRSIDGLLDNYYWKDSFLEKNNSFLLRYIT